jgi:2-oxoisovalerate dehydrogenase E1 component
VSTNRVAVVEARFDELLATSSPAGRRLGADDRLEPGRGPTVREALALYEDQVASRALDVAARELKRTGQSFYTISSAGHEQNAMLGALLRTTDPCFLHYRSGALMMARLRQQPGSTPIFDTLLSLCASSDDPTSGGRHKVWGSDDLWVPPQTSTIASHLPKAMGAAFALARTSVLGVETGLPKDAIVMCSFGDASANHATALTGVNAARYTQRRGAPTPILFVCEDNGIGISVDTPPNWIAESFAHLPHLHYVAARGSLVEVWDAVQGAILHCRTKRAPVFLHLSTVRLWGHAGSDVETTYRTLAEIDAIELGDPLLANARLLIESGAAAPHELRALVADVRARVAAAAVEAARRPKLDSRAAVVAPLAPHRPEACRAVARTVAPPERRLEVFGGKLPEGRTSPTQLTLAAHVNAALFDLFAAHRETLLFGEDVAKKGGVYGLTKGLQSTFGRARVFDTLLDETTILGIAQGAAQLGLLPLPEIQYLAYVHNAIDQLRGEACSLSFFSKGRYTNPMVVRIAGLAYQKGFGGHFHNDNSIGALREIPGLAIAVPSRGDDAARLLRGAFAMAKADGRVVVFLEPIALYHERDLLDGDSGWLCAYPGPDEVLLPGEVGVYGAEHRDLLVVSYANGLRLARRAAHTLGERHGIRVRVLDLRWLAPLPLEAVERHARECGGVLVVDECRATGAGVADALIAHLAEAGVRGPFGSVRAADSYVPLGPATEHVLVTEEQIVAAAAKLVR